MKTRSAHIRAPWQVEIREISLPDVPAAGDVLIRVDACGICGTDVSAFTAGATQWEPSGHEVAGTVMAVGHGEARLKVGQRVVLETASFCGQCDLCRNGRVDLCVKAPNFWGRPAMGFSDLMLVPSACVVPFTQPISAAIACLAEPAGVAYDMVRTAGITLGSRVAIVGLGPIGLMAASLAKYSGAARIVAIARSASLRRLEIAAEIGCEAIPYDGPLDQLESLRNQFDHVLMTAPVECIAPALTLLSYGGEMTYIGIGTGNKMISFDANDFHFRKLQLRASFASPALYLPVVLDLLAGGIIPGEMIISHRFGLSQMNQAMRTLRDDRAGVAKIVIEPSED